MRNEYVLIGPKKTGKTTISAILSTELKLPICKLDKLRWQYYEEFGYAREFADSVNRKPFEASLVERVLTEYSNCVFDFGAGHSVYENALLLRRIKVVMSKFENVILLLPSPDKEASIRILRDRLKANSVGNMKLTLHFLNHPSNYELATRTVYTSGREPEQTAIEILEGGRS